MPEFLARIYVNKGSGFVNRYEARTFFEAPGLTEACSKALDLAVQQEDDTGFDVFRNDGPDPNVIDIDKEHWTLVFEMR